MAKEAPMPETLKHITIEGFKSIAAIRELELQPINLIIGPNGSGKSNFVGAFGFLHAIREGRLQEYVRVAGGANRLLHFGTKRTNRLWIEIQFGNVNRYDVELTPAAGDTLVPTDENAWFFGNQIDRWTSRYLLPDGLEAGISKAQQNQPISKYVREHLALWRVYHFHDTGNTSPLKATSQVADVRSLRSNGSNLAPFLRYLSLKFQGHYDLIVSAIRSIAPFFDDFVLEPDPFNEDTVRLEWKHIGSDEYFNADSLSDGTLRFIALATLFLQPVALRPSVILVDEPELGLHPSAIAELSSLIRTASKTSQVIVSTQSPWLIDHFRPDEILVANRVNGGTTLERLRNAELSEWLQDYSLGELWEKSHIGGRPSLEA